MYQYDCKTIFVTKNAYTPTRTSSSHMRDAYWTDAITAKGSTSSHSIADLNMVITRSKSHVASLTHVGLGHAEAGADLAAQQRLQPALLLCVSAVADQHLHVAGVGRRAVKHLPHTA